MTEKLREFEEKNARLEEQVSKLKTEIVAVKSQLFRFEDVKEDSEQLEFLTGLNEETWDCLWQFLDVTSNKDILSAKSAATEKREERKRNEVVVSSLFLLRTSSC